MEQLNKVELIGTVGTIRMTEVGESSSARLSLATNYAYRSKDGAAVIETTWHNVVCFEGKAVCPLQEIVKGDTLHVLGRLRRRRYLAESGEERFVVEVLAFLVEKLPVAVYHPESS